MTAQDARDFLLGKLQDSLNDNVNTDDFVAALDDTSLMYFDSDADGDQPWFIVMVVPAKLIEA